MLINLQALYHYRRNDTEFTVLWFGYVPCWDGGVDEKSEYEALPRRGLHFNVRIRCQIEILKNFSSTTDKEGVIACRYQSIIALILSRANSDSSNKNETWTLN